MENEKLTAVPRKLSFSAHLTKWRSSTKNFINNSIKAVEFACNGSRFRLLVFIPALLLLCMSIAVLFSPQLFLSLVSMLLLYAGIAAIYLGWKVLLLHRKFSEVVQQVETRLYFRGPNQAGSSFDMMQEGGSKKNIVH